MATGPWDSFKTQPAETSEPQEQGPWAQFSAQKPVEESAPWTQFAKAEPKPEDQSVLRQVADVPLKAGAGLITGVRLVADAFGAGSGVSNTLKGAEDWVADLYSAQSKQDSQEIARIMKDAEDKGVADQVKAAVKAFTVAPVDTVVNALGTSAPAIAAALGASVLGAGAAVATGVGAGIGATMGAGTVKGSIYDAVKGELEKTDMPPEQIEARAQAAQDYNGKNLDMILGGAALGTIGATTGFEPAAARQMAKQIMGKAVAKEAAEEAAKAAERGAIKHGAITGVKEFAGEAAEGGQEQLAQNVALQREGYAVPTMRGVAGQAALEGLAGMGLGSVGGAREAMQAKRDLAAKEGALPPEDRQATTENPALVEERVQKHAEELSAQGIERDDALKMAVRAVAEEDAAKETPAQQAVVADVVPDPERVAELKDQFQQQFNLTPQEAETTAVELATEEAKEDALAQTDTTGAEDVGQPIDTTGGVSSDVVGQPDQVSPTGGAGEVAADGMVPTGEDVAPAVEGEGTQPAALTEEAAPEPQPVEEGAQVGTETTEAVQAEAQGQEPAPAAEVTEESVAEETKPLTAKEKKTKDKANLKEVEALEAKFAEIIKPLDEAAEEDMRQAEAQDTITDPAYRLNFDRNRRLEKAKVIRQIMEMRERMKSASPEVKARLTDLINSPAISQQEYNDVKKGMELQRKYSAQNLSTGKVNAGLSKATNGAQALTQVLKTGNAFQKLLAQRLYRFVNGVKFVVLEKGDALPEQLQSKDNAEAWERARGLYIQNDATNTKTVYVRGASFGEDQGVNNVTVLHELLHAATNQKIELGMLASARGFSTDAKITRFIEEINGLSKYAEDVYKYAVSKGIALPKGMRELVESTNGEIFTNPKEFVAYGMSEPAFQEFLNKLQGQRKNGFSQFVEAILKLFGLGNEKLSALSDLIDLTDKLLSARKTPTMQLVEKGMPKEKVSAQAQQLTKATQKQVDKLTKSSFADNLRDTIPAMTALRGDIPMADVLNVNLSNWKLGTLRQLLPTLQTETLVQWADRIQVGNERGIPGIAESWQAMGDMVGMRTKLTNAMGKINEKLSAIAEKSPEQYKKLADVMHFATLISKDPATNKTNPALTRMWGELTPENQKLYEDIRDFYKNSHELYHQLLDEQLSGSDLNPDAKEKLIAHIKKMYEDGKKLYPYFPLMRYGQFWVRVGKGKDGEFHMFESAKDRDYFVLQRVRQLNESRDTRTKDQMMKDMDLDEGNDLTSARRNDTSASDMLKQIFNTIDASEKGGEVKADALKDEIYQLYLQTLPDRNFRRQYLKRQGKAGFSGDIQRNFINAGTNSANQLSRIKYGPRVMDQLTRAEASLEGNPDKARLGEFVSEMRIRAEMQVRPDPESGALFEASKLVNTSAFLWMMTSIKTTLAQFTAIPIFAAPVLASKHGTAKTAAALGKAMNVFNEVGKFGKDGNYNLLGMLSVSGLNADEKAAIQYMQDRGLSDTTMAFELGSRRDVSTAAYTNPVRVKMRQVANAMTALFHHSERLIREVTFMTSYRLNREEGKTHEASLRLAEAESHEALNNYHASNRPRGVGATKEREVLLNAHKPLGRALFQFKMYPAFVTTYFVRNFYRMTRDMDPEVRAEARKQFLGSLSMSFALGGYVGIPGISFAMGILQGLANGLRGDDDDDELESRNLEFWFRNKWLPETFGGVKIGGKGLDELLDRGVIAGLTGYDITSSLSMNNMWFPEQKDQATLTGEVQSTLLSMMGPGASLATSQIPKGIDYFNQGKILQGMEQWAPALFRGGISAYRYSQEGATTSSGAVIKEPDEFTKGQLMAQAAGFVTEGLQAKREAIFKLQGEILKVKQERSDLLNRLDLEINKGSDEDVEKTFDKIMRFNSRNPMDSVSPDNLQQSLKKHMERRLMSDRGFPIDKKYYPFVSDLLEPSSKKLDREAAK